MLQRITQAVHTAISFKKKKIPTEDVLKIIIS